jgi:hypothetical protein
MVQPLTTQNSPLTYWGRGQLDYYRSGAQGQIHNGGDVSQINGFSIDVSGSASSLVSTNEFTPGLGNKTIKAGDVSSLLAPSTLTDALKLQEVPKQTHEFTQAEIDAVKKKDAGIYAVAIPEDVQVTFVPTGAEPHSVELPDYIPGDVFQQGKQLDYIKSEVARDGELAKIEADLRHQYGPDVKLGYDPLGEEYILLRPGQRGYDKIESAEDIFRKIPEELQKLGFGLSPFRDLLDQYKAFL